MYSKPSFTTACPESARFITNTSFLPSAPGGVLAVRNVEFSTFIFNAKSSPIITIASFSKLLPLMVITVPPSTDPRSGTILFISGDVLGILYLNPLLMVDFPPSGFFIVISAYPGFPLFGARIFIVVLFTTLQ